MLHPSGWPVLGWLTGGVALPQPKCNSCVDFAIARWLVGKASDKARIMLSCLFRYSLVVPFSDFDHEVFLLCIFADKTPYSVAIY